VGKISKLGAALAVAALALPGAAWAAGPAPTPPMGWNPWYRFGCGINEQLIAQTADAMVASGMRDLGYRYVIIDDCWMAGQRDANGALTPDPNRFPHGIAALADYVHARGLKLGIYIDAGMATCAGFPGSQDHYARDAATLASWNVDYVKVDWCHTPNLPAWLIYNQVRAAIDASGRQMLLAVCNWGIDDPWIWAPRIATSWRTTGDYNWYGAPRNYWRAVLTVADINAHLAQFAHPSAWNDPDMLLAGTGPLDARQERSQINLWSMMAAPLLAGADVRSMSARTRVALTNRDVIAVDQDPAGEQGVHVVKRGRRQVWVRRLADGSRALLLFNGDATSATLSAGLGHLGLAPAARYTVQDLWAHRTSAMSGRLRVRLRPHDSALFRVWRRRAPRRRSASAQLRARAAVAAVPEPTS
jgi:alpha-galactosidase